MPGCWPSIRKGKPKVKITDDFIEKIKLERDLLMLVDNVVILATALKEVQNDLEEIKKQEKNNV